jgi:SAM-dependent methyltransferase
MRASDWIQEPVASLLDVGCNAGVWLQECARRYPNAHLAGVDINKTVLERIRPSVRADLHHAGAEKLPFADASFQYVTCIEVLEHLPAELRTAAFREMNRVLQPGGRLILTVPHAGWFAWFDSNNVRLRVPGLYEWLVGNGRRDSNYAAQSRNVEWHQHFSEEEVLGLVGDRWKRVAVRRGGLFLYPLMDWLSWPFYRFGMSHHGIRRLFERIAGWDYRIDFGKASYGVLIVLERESYLKSAPDLVPVKSGTASEFTGA